MPATTWSAASSSWLLKLPYMSFRHPRSAKVFASRPCSMQEPSVKINYYRAKSHLSDACRPCRCRRARQTAQTLHAFKQPSSYKCRENYGIVVSSHGRSCRKRVLVSSPQSSNTQWPSRAHYGHRSELQTGGSRQMTNTALSRCCVRWTKCRTTGRVASG